MNFSLAAITATYPLVIFLNALIILRYVPVLTMLESGVRHLVCSTIIILVGITFEQLLYGYGRISGSYVTIATNPVLVGIGKLLYIAGSVYMLYAFWLIKPNHIKWWNYPAVAFIVWTVLVIALMG
jgi:hypothetical protein